MPRDIRSLGAGTLSGRLWVMIAGPWSSGAADAATRDVNLARLNQAALAVHRRGHVPVVGVNLGLPVARADPSAQSAEQDALVQEISAAAAERCDAVLRIQGVSAGADREVERIAARGGAVFHHLDELPRAVPEDPA
jgi:hypothetical protein